MNFIFLKMLPESQSYLFLPQSLNFEFPQDWELGWKWKANILLIKNWNYFTRSCVSIWILCFRTYLEEMQQVLLFTGFWQGFYTQTKVASAKRHIRLFVEKI